MLLMKKYTQFSYEERTKLYDLKQAGLTYTQMSALLGRHKSSIWRELRRNSTHSNCYLPDTAQSLASTRCLRDCLLDKHLELQEFVVLKLQCHGWTPEQIAGWLKKRQKQLPTISHESIYAWIYKPPQKREKYWKYLARHKGKRGLRKYRGAGVSRIPHRISIFERPKSVEFRKYFGHWEGDLMSFCKNSQHILTVIERKTRFLMSVRLPSKKAECTASHLINLMKAVPKHARKTITLDNGGEFATHRQYFEKLGIKSYFCDPYASWQKGSIEHANGRIRRDLPRKFNIHKLTKEDFDETIENYNNTPRKVLGWLTPLEAYVKNLKSVALQT